MSGEQVVRTEVPERKNYADYREDLRHDFWYTCAYCSLAESEATGIRFEIDHYWPKEHFPQLQARYENLYYACGKCNGYKSDYFPNERAKSRGHRFVKVDEESPLDHVTADGDRLEPRTSVGEFNIHKLNLNRRALRRLRELRRRMYDSRIVIAHGLRSLFQKRLDDYHDHSDRHNFFALRARLLRQAKEHEKNVEELLRERLHAPMVDPELRNSSESKDRQRFLKEIGAIAPRKRQ